MEFVPMNESYWTDKPVDVSRGINFIEVAGDYLSTVFKGWQFAVFTEADIEDRRAIEGYIVMTPQHMEKAIKDWNNGVSMRFGFREQDGAVMIGAPEDKLFVCARPLDWGNRRRSKVFNNSEDAFDAARYGKAKEIKQSMGRGFNLGVSLTESTSQTSPDGYTEGSGDESADVYTNADKQASRRGRKREAEQ